MPDLSPRNAVELHQRIRAFLLATMPHESPAAIAAALVYEVASLAAGVCTTEDDAKQLLAMLLDAARAQIEAFGVGHPHP
jgi:hypothetical protein